MKYAFRTFLVSTIFFLAPVFLHAQPWAKKLPQGATFEEIKKAFYEYYESGAVIPRVDQNIYDEELDKFKRWEWYTEARLDEEGRPMNGSKIISEWYRMKAQQKTLHANSVPANWTLVGPQTVPDWGGGAGRINTMEFDPQNSSKIWIGSAGGGVWKTDDGGTTWQNETPDLPVLSIADIAIHPQHSDTVFVATGDCYGYDGGSGDFWGGTYSGGVYKTYNGGISWDTAGLNFLQSDTKTILRLIINPANPNILLAATTNGLWRTTNGTASWAQVSTKTFYDLEIKPGNPAKIYASDKNSFYQSSDTGATWTMVVNLASANGRSSIAVTPANPSVVYFWAESGEFYKSTNGGSTFVAKTSPNSQTTFYGYYDNVLSVSNTNENDVLVGGLNIVESTNGGGAWGILTHWDSYPGSDYVHADNHDIEFLPGSGSTFFSCNDGGIFKTTDNGSSWNDLSGGLSIAQFYRVSSSFTNPDVLYTGQQDNGIARKIGTDWTQVRGADGMNVLVDYTNSDIAYASTQYGNLGKTENGGNSFFDVSPTSNGAWITPFVMHPDNHEMVYAGYDEVYETTDGGGTRM